MPTTSREIHLARRPVGWPTTADFAAVDVELPDPVQGQVLVQNSFVSVDPYMRGRMSDAKSYAAPYVLDEVMTGGAVGRVLASGTEDLAVGDLVLSELGWRTHALADAAKFRRLDPVPGVSESCFLGVLGMTALTAYAGLLEVAAFQAGDAVFVSGAAGAVGSMVGQIARLKGASRVVGSAGSADKVEHLTRELGFDAAFNYKDGEVRTLLKQAAPDGIDVYFDNVGGEHLEAAISRLNLRGRIAMCGAISAYNATQPPAGPRNLSAFIGKRLTMRGFLVNDHYGMFTQFADEVGGWYASGRLVADETVVDGIDNAPEAFLALLRGENKGKMLVRLEA